MHTHARVMRRARPLWSVLALGVIGLSQSQATVLKIARAGDKIVISWPKDATGYGLEVASQLAASAWAPATNSPALVGSEMVVTNPVVGISQFFRLTAPGPSAPSVSNLVAIPASVSCNSTSVISFNFGDPDCDIVMVDIMASNHLGVMTANVPARWLGLAGCSGQVALPVPASNLPFGETVFTLRLRDSRGGTSEQQNFAFEVVGAASGGAVPEVIEFINPVPVWNRPTGPSDRVRPVLVWTYSDLDGDLERVRVRVMQPDSQERGMELKAVAQGMIGTQGTVSASWLEFSPASPLGLYSIELTLIDRNGNFSSPATASVQLVDSGGETVPGILDFTPAQGAADTVVTLTGSGFDATNPTNNVVTLSGLPMEVLAGTDSSLTVVVPDDAWAGTFVVRNAKGVAASTNLFIVPTSVTVTPQSAQVTVGATQQFDARVVSAPSHLVSWTVNGIAGGNGAVGTITSDGLYSAPADVPAGGAVTVAARLVSNPAVTNAVSVTILPPPSLPGAAMILASVGGTVRSADGRAAVSIPANALPGNTTILVKALQGTNAPPPEASQRVLGAVEFGPDGTAFNEPVTVLLPLTVHQPPGTQLPILLFQSETGTYTSEGAFATVAESGEEAIAQTSHFSTLVVMVPVAPGPPTPPVVSSISPMEAEEGMKLPLLITGMDLTPDLVVEVLTNGVETLDIIPGSLYALGDKAGVLLDIQTIPNLPEGASRIYTLRLRRFLTSVFTNLPFTVHGLDELTVGSGQNRTLGANENGRYSRVEVAAGGTLTSSPIGAIDLHVTGPVLIHGSVVASGADGASGQLHVGGSAGTGGGLGGQGGNGREDSGCFEDPIFGISFSSDPYDCAEPQNFGGDSNLPRPNDRPPLGVGGAPGINVNIVNDFISTLTHAVECVGSAGLACVQLAADVYEIAEEASSVAVGDPVGKQGFPGVPSSTGFGNGGGGGGGGGRFAGIFSSIQGGGGGAGGDGGRPIFIVTARSLELAGRITTAGGQGGDGADNGERIPLIGLETGYTGGGGGGGSGGRLTLTASDGIHRLPGSVVDTRGGSNGFGGIRVFDASAFTLKKLVFRSDRRARAAGGGFRETNPLGRVSSAATPVFFPKAPDNTIETDHRVTTRGLLYVRFKDDRVPLALNQAPVQVIQGDVTNEFVLIRQPGFEFAGNVLLAPGFNRLAVAGMHDLLQKRVLFLAGPDSDGDGLFNADEDDLGTDPNKADTDDDGVNDRAEVLGGTDPLRFDSDEDGLSDGQELALGTSPANPDSDGDGVTDGAEVLLGSNSLSNASTPAAVPRNVLFAESSGPTGSFLIVIDPGTGAYGLLGQPNNGQQFGLAFDTLPVLFVSRLTSLAAHQPLAQTTSPIGSFGAPGGVPLNILSLAYQPTNDTVYGIEEGPNGPTGQLVAIDPGTGAGTRVGPAGADPIHSLLVLQDGRLLAAVKGPGNSDRLVRLNAQTGTIDQEIGAIGATPITGMALATNGVIYAAQRLSGAESRLLTISPSTGQGTPTVLIRRAVTGLALLSFRKVSALVSINRFEAASGSRSSEGFVSFSADGRYLLFQSQATDLVSLPDNNDTIDAFVRDLKTGSTELISLNQAGTEAAAAVAAQGGSFPAGISADGRYVVFHSTAGDIVSNDANGQNDVFRRDRSLGITELVSVNASGQAGWGLYPKMSEDGRYIVFRGDLDDIVPFGDGNQTRDVFVRDMLLGTTMLVSRDASGSLDGPSEWGDISANGRVVVFNFRQKQSSTPQVFARDLVANTLHHLTDDSLGMPQGGAPPFAISNDGRWVAFASGSAALSAPLADGNGGRDVFLYDMQTGTRTLVSVNLAGTATGSGESYQPSISADGRYVAFTSSATNLASVTDTNDTYDVFVRDMQTGTTTSVSVDATGNATGFYGRAGLPGSSFGPVITPDGQRILFASYATNLVNLPPGLNQRSQDVYVRDLPTGGTKLLSVNYRGTALGAGPSGQGGVYNVSANGQVAAFTSLATNLVRLADTNASPDVYFRPLAP